MTASPEETTPRPDPTSLTTQQLDRAVETLHELIETEVRCLREVINEKLAGVEAEAAGHWRLADERHGNLAEQRLDARASIAAAFESAKELVALQSAALDKSIAKSEAATAKQVDALGVLLQKSAEATDEKIGDLKSRLDRIESAKQGGTETRSEGRQWVAAGIGVAAFLMAVVAAILSAKP